MGSLTPGAREGGVAIQRSIPAGGLFTGAEEIKTVEQQILFGGVAKAALDTCYHRVRPS